MDVFKNKVFLEYSDLSVVIFHNLVNAFYLVSSVREAVLTEVILSIILLSDKRCDLCLLVTKKLNIYGIVKVMDAIFKIYSYNNVCS